MATIGSLAIKLTASAGALIAPVKKAAKTVAGLGKSALAVLNPFTALKSILGGLAIGGLVAFGKHAISSAAQLARTARIANISVRGFAALQHAFRGFGEDTEAVTRGLSHLNEILSGIGPDAEFAGALLGKFGMSLKDLGAGDTFEAVKKIADAVASTTDPLQKATLAFAAFGPDAGAWLPILNEGAAGIDKVAAKAQALGLSFSEIDANNLEKINGEFNQMEDIVDGISRQSAVQLADQLGEVTANVNNIAASMLNVGNIVRKVFRAFEIGWKAVVVAGMAAVASIIIGFMKLYEGVLRVLGKLNSKFTRMANDIAATAGILKNDARKEMQGYIDNISRGFDGVEQTVAKRESAIKFGKKLNAGGAVPAFERYKKQISGFVNVFEQTQSPIQHFQEKLNELNTFLQGTGAIDNYARGVAGLVSELEKVHQLSEVKLSGAVQAGTAAAASAINQSEALNNRRLRETPQERVNRIMQQSLEIEKQQLEYQRKIAEALRPPQTVRIG